MTWMFQLSVGQQSAEKNAFIQTREHYKRERKREGVRQGKVRERERERKKEEIWMYRKRACALAKAI